MKKALLLVAFGSSRQEAHLSLRQFEDRVRARFPGLPVRWAFTSGVVRGKLADKGKKTDSASKALEKMWFEKFTNVAVQSLHVITGAEYDGLVADVERFSNDEISFEHITLGRPLIGGCDDIPRVVQAIMNNLPPDRHPEEPVILMGHGTWHAGDSLYDDLSDALRKADPSVMLATMDGRLTIEDAKRQLQAEGKNTAWLMPLMALPGRHVQKDMCGKGPQSWVSILKAASIEPKCYVSGTATIPDFADIWLDHLEEALADTPD